MTAPLTFISRSAVCGFEAFINGKHIVGEVKEKEIAHREYKGLLPVPRLYLILYSHTTEAVAQGHGAYLMDEGNNHPELLRGWWLISCTLNRKARCVFCECRESARAIRRYYKDYLRH